MLIALKVGGKTDGHNLFQILSYYFFQRKAAKRFFSFGGRCGALLHRQLLSWLVARWLHFIDDNRTINQAGPVTSYLQVIQVGR